MEIFKKTLENGWFTNPATKKTRAFLLIIVVVLIVAIIVNPFKSETAQSVENQLESSIKKLENNSDATETENTALSGVLYDELAARLSESGYTFYIFTGQKSVIKKNVDGDGDKYTFELSGEQYGELAGKKYFYDGSVLYDTTKTSEKLENEQKNEILAKLMTYLPESFCPTKSFNRLIAFADKNTLEMSEAFYGESAKAYIDGKCFIQQWEDGICKIAFEK